MGYVDIVPPINSIYIYIYQFDTLVIGNSPLAAVLLCLIREELMCGEKDSTHPSIT